MLRSLKDLEHYTVAATDGEVGKVVNFLFDDEHWTIRYLVAETGGFFDGRRVLISPISFRQADWSTRQFQLALSKEKVRNSPDVDTDKPVSRQYEQDFHQYYGYPLYWGYPAVWGMGGYPDLLATGTWSQPTPSEGQKPKEPKGDAHLRSAHEVRGYHIEGQDDSIGHVEDFIVDDETWQLRYLVVDTRNWWFGKHVLVPPHWAKEIRWEDRKVHVDLPRDVIKNAPEWNRSAAVNRDYEERLYAYYQKPSYWRAHEPPSAQQVQRQQRV